MNSKKAKAIRKIARTIAQRSDLKAFGLMAKSPENRTTAVVHPRTQRGVLKTIKRAAKGGK